ncbi:hypothetical protein SUNI508_08634 [Seiridium unicorne]|uniref:Uncharacterized protein n=1 Tax=Seiridium unicorne TaxID=138068 RepID=A0ABR2US43_9PEZI
MTTDGASRPSVDGARPTSRFQEGSMNDRASAAPPVQFLGPEEAAEFERQFYRAESAKNGTQRTPKRTRSLSRRRERPISAQAQLQSLPYATLQLQEEQAKPRQEEDQTDAAQKKPGLLGRVREALFGKSTALKPVASNVQNEIGKRTSLQQPPTSYTQTPARPMPIPVQRDTRKSLSQSAVPQLPASFHGPASSMNDRPSRDEIMASYNELMATGFFKAHAIQSTRQPAPGSQPNVRRAAPPLPTIPSPDRPSVDQGSERPSFNITPPSPSGREFVVPPMPSSLPPPPPIFPSHQVRLKPSWESFRNGLRGRKRARADCSDDNASESASMLSQSLASSSTTHQIATQVGGIGRRVSKKLRKMPSAISNQLQSKSDGMIRVVPNSSDGPETEREDRAVRMRSPSPASPGMATGHKDRGTIGSRRGSISGRLRKRADKGKSPSRPPVALNNYPHLDPHRMARGPQPDHRTANWEPMDVDGANSSRASLDSIQREDELENAARLLGGGQMETAAQEPLSVVPDMNRGIPSVPQIPKYYKHGRTSVDENSGMEVTYGLAL